MATVRVFFVTYRRATLLRRALASLLAQTFKDWVCELHNDAPDDPEPGRLLAEIGDSRITLHQHEHNWGPVETFNHAFAGGDESYASVLEDDNWWEPTFLRRAIDTFSEHPDADIIWSNMKIWQENADGSWTDTGKKIWRDQSSNSFREFRWPILIQSMEALHSQGAMVYRQKVYDSSCVPIETPLTIIESVRERGFQGSLVLLPDVLANFALTLKTARGHDRLAWLQSQLLLAASFFSHVQVSNKGFRALWNHQRNLVPPSTGILFELALAGATPKGFLRFATLKDWLRFIASFFRHPIVHLRALRFRNDYPEVWQFLMIHSRARTEEAKARGFKEIGETSLLSKSSEM